MPGFNSKKKAALDEEGFYLVHQTNHHLEHPMSEKEKEPWHMKREIQIGFLYRKDRAARSRRGNPDGWSKG